MSNPLIRWIKRIESRQVPDTVVATNNTTITHAQAIQGVVVSNKGAGGEVVVSLPAAVPGMRVTGVVQAAQLLGFDPVDTEIIYGTNGVALTEDVAIKANAVGETIQLVCVEKGFWVVTAFSGTWTTTGA
jgi:uncharacterized protein (DUF362 family)